MIRFALIHVIFLSFPLIETLENLLLNWATECIVDQPINVAAEFVDAVTRNAEESKPLFIHLQKC